jgi:mannose-6-phosphate isomerase-like protein (cupin superfamily)
MSEQTNEPRPAPGDRIQQFITAVDRTLAEGGMAEEERQNIVGDLRVQIEEMLSARAGSSGKPTAIEDVEAVLSELDPPESYSQGEAAKEAPRAESGSHSCGHEQRHGHGHRHWRRGGPYWFWKKRRVADAVRRAIHSFSPFGHPAFAGMTERARNALGLAKGEARRMQHDFIGTEHLLLGLILEGSGVAAKVLADLGVTIDRAREQAARLVGPGTNTTFHDRLPLTPRLRQAIEEARLQARNLGHDYLGTEHLLLALLDIPAVAPQVLTNLGLKLEDVRQEILRRFPVSTTQAPPQASVTYWPASAAQQIKIGSNEYRVVAGGTDTGGVYSAIEATISGPDGLGIRKHTREDISVLVQEGSLRLQVGERIVDLNKGDFSRVPRGTSHELQPTGQPARVLIIAAPSGLERAVAALSHAPNVEAMREAAIQHGISPQ